MEQEKKRNLLALIDDYKLIRDNDLMFQYGRISEYMLKSGTDRKNQSVIERFITNFQRTTKTFELHKKFPILVNYSTPMQHRLIDCDGRIPVA